MVSETGLTQDPAPEPGAGYRGGIRRRSRRKVRSRRQTKFPRPVRLMLWLGLPVLLWAGIFGLWHALS